MSLGVEMELAAEQSIYVVFFFDWQTKKII